MVNKEVAHWVATKPADHILPVVTDGTWERDASANDFSPATPTRRQPLNPAAVTSGRGSPNGRASGEVIMGIGCSATKQCVAVPD